MVTVDQAATFLADRFGPDIGDVEPIGSGEWSRAYGFGHGDTGYVVRFGQHVEDFEKDRRAAAFASPDLPIPAVVEIGKALGGWYAVSERAFGRFIDDLTGDEMRVTLPSLFAALDAMREADVSATTGYGFWGADGNGVFPMWRETLLGVATEWSGSRLTDWRQRLVGSPTGIGPFDEATRHLHELAQHSPEERHLIHSDLLHVNVLVDDHRIAAVVDWGCSMYGDHLYDVAWLEFWAPWFPAWNGIDFTAEAVRHYATIGLEVPHLAERVRACQIHIGLDNQKYNAWKGSWADVETVAARTLAIARGVG